MSAIFVAFHFCILLITYSAISLTSYNATKRFNQLSLDHRECNDWLKLQDTAPSKWPCTFKSIHSEPHSNDQRALNILKRARCELEGAGC